jgi:hypothetical protein
MRLTALPLDVPTFTTSRLLEILAAKGGTYVGEKWPINFTRKAVNLRHGTNGFTSLPKEVVLRIFSP